jgi:hypothetical protein
MKAVKEAMYRVVYWTGVGCFSFLFPVPQLRSNTEQVISGYLEALCWGPDKRLGSLILNVSFCRSFESFTFRRGCSFVLTSQGFGERADYKNLWLHTIQHEVSHHRGNKEQS